MFLFYTSPIIIRHLLLANLLRSYMWKFGFSLEIMLKSQRRIEVKTKNMEKIDHLMS